MTISKLKDQLTRKLKRDNPATQEGPPGPDERDTTIEKLQSAIAEEREHSATLHRTIDELHFKAATLERGYATQLEAARKRRETAEQLLEEHQARLAAFEGAGKNTTQLLDEARAELAKVSAERDRLREALASPAGAGARAASSAPTSAATRARADQMSIDELLEDALWAREQEKINRERRGVDPQPATNLDLTSEELIPPELVFAGKTDEDV